MRGADVHLHPASEPSPGESFGLPTPYGISAMAGQYLTVWVFILSGMVPCRHKPKGSATLMISVILRRLVTLIPVLLGISMLTFGALHLIPGDMATLLVGPEGIQDPAVLDNIRRKYGLDQPLIVQYGVWLKNVVQGDFGQSLRLGVPVSDEILRRLPLTIEIAVLAMAFALVVGGTLGLLASTAGGAWKWIAQILTIGGTAVPNYFLATIFILYGPRLIPWIPALKYTSFSSDPVQHFKSLIYPAVALGVGLAAIIAENTRASVTEVKQQEFVRVARAKGLSERSVRIGHVLRNGLIPIITVTGLQIGYLLGGTIITETVFALPGLGRLALSAATLRDYPMMQGIVLVIATLVLLTNLLADIAYSFADPRVRM